MKTEECDGCLEKKLTHGWDFCEVCECELERLIKLREAAAAFVDLVEQTQFPFIRATITGEQDDEYLEERDEFQALKKLTEGGDE